jgi:predicted nucleic acid-binding protein
MKAFDTDVLTEILSGNPAYAERLAQVPTDEQTVPIIVVEEIVRGRLNIIRQAEAARTGIAVDHAYRLFQQTLADFREVNILPYTQAAEALLKQWRNRSRDPRTTCELPPVAWRIPPPWSRATAAILRMYPAFPLSFGSRLGGHVHPHQRKRVAG